MRVVSPRPSAGRFGAPLSGFALETGRPILGCSSSRRRPSGCSRTRRGTWPAPPLRSASTWGRGGGSRGVANQSIFHLSQFTLLLHDFERSGNNLGLAYFHGRPGTPGMPEFDACFETMRARHAEIDRIQVTNGEMEALVASTGIAPEKVHRIPIGIDVDVFRPRDDAARLAARARLDLPSPPSSSARSRRTG